MSLLTTGAQSEQPQRFGAGSLLAVPFGAGVGDAVALVEADGASGAAAGAGVADPHAARAIDVKIEIHAERIIPRQYAQTMSSEKPDKKPDPIEDVREGLGLLFRAAKNAVKELPTDKLEESLKTGVREVSKAVESVASTIEREVFGAKKDGGAKDGGETKPAEGEKPDAQHEAERKPEAERPETTPTEPEIPKDGGPAGRGET